MIAVLVVVNVSLLVLWARTAKKEKAESTSDEKEITRTLEIHVSETKEPEPTPEPEVETDSAPAPRMQGVHGWLVVFCILVVVSPIYSFISDLLEYGIMKYTIGESLALRMGVIAFLIHAAFFSYGVYVVYSVAKRRSNAVWAAMIYSGTLVLYGVTVLVLMGQDATFAIGTIFWGIIWTLYFTFSRQVKSLFPSETRSVNKYDFLFVLVVVLPWLFIGLLYL